MDAEVALSLCFFFLERNVSCAGVPGMEGLQSNSSPPSVCLAPDPPLMPRPCAKKHPGSPYLLSHTLAALRLRVGMGGG